MTPASRSFARAFLVLALTSALPLPALAVEEAKTPLTTDILLVQQASLVVPRDRITATLSVILRGPDARQIQIEINRRMVAALAKAKEAPDVVAETGSYSVNHPYTSQGPSGFWQGEQTLILTSGDIDAVLNLAGTLHNEGLVMGEMRFFVSPDSLKAVQDELTGTALKAMQDRAANIAGDMSLKVLRYKSINIGNAQEQIGETPTATKGATEGQSRRPPRPRRSPGRRW